jgi:hypothetical protein
MPVQTLPPHAPPTAGISISVRCAAQLRYDSPESSLLTGVMLFCSARDDTDLDAGLPGWMLQLVVLLQGIEPSNDYASSTLALNESRG